MRPYAYAVIAAALLATSYPLAWHPANDDSFPLSTYPMFSRGKKNPMISVSYAVALEADGSRHLVPPALVANREVLQAQAAIRAAIGGGAGKRRALCEAIARRIATRGGHWKRVVEVRLVTGRHDAVKYLTGEDTVGREHEHHRCDVVRAP